MDLSPTQLNARLVDASLYGLSKPLRSQSRVAPSVGSLPGCPPLEGKKGLSTDNSGPGSVSGHYETLACKEHKPLCQIFQ